MQPDVRVKNTSTGHTTTALSAPSGIEDYLHLRWPLLPLEKMQASAEQGVRLSR